MIRDPFEAPHGFTGVYDKASRPFMPALFRGKEAVHFACMSGPEKSSCAFDSPEGCLMTWFEHYGDCDACSYEKVSKDR
jgi:hypothetical protein